MSSIKASKGSNTATEASSSQATSPGSARSRKQIRSDFGLDIPDLPRSTNLSRSLVNSVQTETSRRDISAPAAIGRRLTLTVCGPWPPHHHLRRGRKSVWETLLTGRIAQRLQGSFERIAVQLNKMLPTAWLPISLPEKPAILQRPLSYLVQLINGR